MYQRDYIIKAFAGYLHEVHSMDEKPAKVVAERVYEIGEMEYRLADAQDAVEKHSKKLEALKQWGKVK